MENISSELIIVSKIDGAVPTGSRAKIEVQLQCLPELDLEGFDIEVYVGENHLGSFALGPYADRKNTAIVEFTTPSTIGNHMVRLSFEGAEDESLIVEAAESFISLDTRAHRTAVSVWGLPEALEREQAFSIFVAAKCIDGCQLAGGSIAIEASGQTLAHATLGETPWEGTQALYWCEQTLSAPSTPGKHELQARFVASHGDFAVDDIGSTDAHDDGVTAPRDDAVTAHSESSCAFSIVTLPDARHLLTITVKESGSGELVEGADVRAGFFRGVTDKDGVALVRVASGVYWVSAGKPDFDGTQEKYHIDGDAAIELLITKQPSDEEHDFWV